MKKGKITHAHIFFAIYLYSAFLPIICQNPSDADKALAKQLFRGVDSAKKKGYSLTQSQAHMSVTKIKQLILEKTEELAKNKEIINQTMAREQNYKKDYYVFYTAIPYMHILQDITRKMYARAIGKADTLKNKQFQFIRYNYQDTTYDQYNDATDFLVKQIQTNGLINDRDAAIGTILASSNLALLGNAGFTGESTWYFFNNPQPWGEMNRAFLESSLKTYGYSTEFVDDIINLAHYLKDPAGNLGVDLFQIFVPKKMVDELGYLSWRMGIPFDKDFIKKLFNRKKMTFGIEDNIRFSPDIVPGKTTYLQPTVTEYINKWKKGGKKQRDMSEQLLKNVLQGQFHLTPFLEKYVSDPSSVPELNWAQARLLITNNLLLNPKSGIIIFRYDNHDPNTLRNYKNALNEVINQMEKERQDRLSGNTLLQSLRSLTISLNQLANMVKQ